MTRLYFFSLEGLVGSAVLLWPRARIYVTGEQAGAGQKRGQPSVPITLSPGRKGSSRADAPHGHVLYPGPSVS